MCSIFKLTDEEIKQGELVFEQLQKEVNRPLTFRDTMKMLLIPYYIFKWDFEKFNGFERFIFILFWWPIYYIIFDLVRIIIC